MENIYLDLWRRVIAFYAKEDVTQIAHTQSVIDYTEKIALLEAFSTRHLYLLKTAALLHDIGCPAARALHGKALPRIQELEGQKIAEQYLLDYPDFTQKEKTYIAEIVGSHHQFSASQKLHFEPLFEADLITNLLEQKATKSVAKNARDKMVTTDSGKHLFDILFQLK
ncbi:MAG: HD domain-containing protein [Lentisphaeria bacterium]